MNRLQYIKQTYGHGAQSMIARACDVSAMTACRWVAQGHLPRTDLLGITKYAEAIEKATNRLVTKAELHADIQQSMGIDVSAA
jgi:hypothetical protein